MSAHEPEPLETERRRATVMFADLTGFTSLVEQAGDEEAYDVVSSCLKLLDEIARRHGATVDKYLGDCIMAVFGVPKAVENAPRAAVNAAIEIRERVQHFSRERALSRPLDVHTGICTGPLISGDVSGPVIREFAVMGDTVNIAARLKDLAPPGRIWVGAETWRATRYDFEYQSLDALPLKGKEKRVEVYEVRSTQPSVYRQRPGARGGVHSDLVGRVRELETLREAMAAVGRGEGRVVSLTGDPGLGKSRLVAELATAPEATAVTWLEGRAVSTGRTLSYHPFRDLLRAWLGPEAESGDADARARLEAELTGVLPGESDEVFPLIATVAGIRLDAEGRRRLASIQGDAKEKMIHRAMARLVAMLADRKPLWLVFDDLHWADLSSIELLEALLPLAESHAIGFLLIQRPRHAETSERVLTRVRRDHAAQHRELALAPLTATEVRVLLANLFGAGDVPHAVRRVIEERSAGNPFFAEEVVRALIDEGALEMREEGLSATERIHSAVIPGTVQEVIMARIDALDSDGRHVLDAASVMGGAFYLRVLAEVVRKEHLEEILARLEQAGLVVNEDPIEGRFTFKHLLIQEVAYETLLRSRRTELHRAVGEAMELVLTDNVPGWYAMLAYHFGLGRDLERSEEYLFRAGDEAASSAASNEALRFFQEAARVYTEIHGADGDPRKQSLLERRVAEALFNRGQLTDAVTHFDRALAPLGDALARGATLYPNAALDLLAVLKRLHRSGWERLRPATDVECEVIAIRFERALAQTTTAPEFVPDTISTLRLLARVDPRTVPESGGLLAGAIGIFSYGGVSFGLGRRALAIASDLAETGNVRELLLYYRLMRFIHHFLEGDWSETHFVDDALIDEGLRNGRFWEAAVALDIDGECALFRGDHARVERRLAQLESLATEYGNDVALSARRSLGALLAMERGQLDEAWQQIERYREEHSEHTYQVVALGTRARIELLQGRPDDAAESLTRAEARIREAGLVPPLHRSFFAAPRYQLDVSQLEAARTAGDRSAARRWARRARRSRRTALRAAARVAARRTEILRFAAAHDWLRGRRARALRGYTRAVETGRALGARPELARTCAEIARRLGEKRGPDALDGRDASAWRAEATAIFDELGLRHEAPGIERPPA